MRVMAIALGGCISGQPNYGITEDTGGHITYILGAMQALARQPDVTDAEIVTRLFDAPEYGNSHSQPVEYLGANLRITRIDSGNRSYLAKERLAADRNAFTQALLRDLHERDVLPDVIHAHFSDAADVALSVREEFGIPVVYTPHSLGIEKAGTGTVFSPELQRRVEEEDRIIGAVDAIVASSRDECERQLASYPSANCETIWSVRPGIDQTRASAQDIASASALIAPFLRDTAKPIILAIARPVKKKNLAALVRAFAEHPSLRDDANLVIVPGLRSSIDGGEEEQAEVMRELVNEIDLHNLHGCVAYPKRHSKGDVRGLYALAARSRGVFVNPALIEPYGLTILEAAVHGLPVVATRNGGPADIVAELQHGEVVDPTDTSAIGSTVSKLIKNPTLWQTASDNGSQRVQAVQWETYAAQFLRICRTLVKPNRVATIPLRSQKHLVLCDIDNTLTGCRRSSEELRRYLHGRSDLVFGIATGRSLVEAKRLVLEWDLAMPEVWITSVGSEVYWHTATGLQRDCDFAGRLERDWDVEQIAELMADIPHTRPQPAIEQREFKQSYFVENPASVSLMRQRLRDSGLSARIIYSHGNLLDIVPLAAGKGEAMRHVSRKLNIPLDRVIVAGDSGNDIDMIEACPNAVIVANCERELRAMATHGRAYLAKRKHAAGVLEGIQAHMDRIQNHQIRSAA